MVPRFCLMAPKFIRGKYDEVQKVIRKSSCYSLRGAVLSTQRGLDHEGRSPVFGWPRKSGINSADDYRSSRLSVDAEQLQSDALRFQ